MIRGSQDPGDQLPPEAKMKMMVKMVRDVNIQMMIDDSWFSGFW